MVGTLLGAASRRTVADGTTHVTDNGWPLSYRLGTLPADTNSQALKVVWWVVSPDGDPISATP